MYTSSWHSSKSRLYIAVVGMGGGTFAFFGLSTAFYRQFRDGEMSSADVLIAICGILLMLWGIFFAFRPMILQTIRCCFTIELSDTRVIGTTIFNKRQSLEYDAIEKIIGIKRYSFLRANILLVDRDGKELEIHQNIDNLGQCIEDIRRRCTNLKEVDYKGLDRDPRVWHAANKHAML